MWSQPAICILSSEVPFDRSIAFVSIVLPGIDLAFKQVPILNSAVQALAAENGDLDLGHVEPAGMLGRVVKLHSAK